MSRAETERIVAELLLEQRRLARLGTDLPPDERLLLSRLLQRLGYTEMSPIRNARVTLGPPRWAVGRTGKRINRHDLLDHTGRVVGTVELSRRQDGRRLHLFLSAPGAKSKRVAPPAKKARAGPRQYARPAPGVPLDANGHPVSHAHLPIRIVHSSHPTAFRIAVRRVFGRDIPDEHLARAAGAFGGGRAHLHLDYRNNPQVSFYGPRLTGDREALHTDRTFLKDPRGRVELDNGHQVAHPLLRGGGAERFGETVRWARRIGVHHLTTTAAGDWATARDPDHPMNGYYTWPRFGYNAPLESRHLDQLPDHILEHLRRVNPAGDYDLHQLFGIPGLPNLDPHTRAFNPPDQLSGAGAWQRFGRSVYDARFDVHPDSPHSKHLEAYLNGVPHGSRPAAPDQTGTGRGQGADPGAAGGPDRRARGARGRVRAPGAGVPARTRVPGSARTAPDHVARYSLANRSGFLDALRRMSSSNQDALRRTADRLAHKLGVQPVRVVRAVHDTPHGSVPGVAVASYADAPPDRYHELAAWVGSLANLPGAAVFHARDDGPDRLHRIRQHGSGADLRARLDRWGLTSRVLVPHKKGFDVLIPDRGGRHERAVAGYAEEQGSPLETSRGHLAVIGAPDQGAARKRFRDTISAAEAQRLSRRAVRCR